MSSSGNIAISIKNLSKRYLIGKKKDTSLRGTLSSILKTGNSSDEEFWALRDIDLEIQNGDVIGIIGKNGAGKSTLLKVLSQITRPTTGRIEINGRVASLLEVGTGFHPELTGRENIFLNGTILGMTRKEVAAKFDEIVDFSGIGKFIDTPVKRYSSGMYVRLAFAVAAHLEPEILIIDEVLAVGDDEFQKKCIGKMKDVAGEGRTVIFVSHDLGAVKNLCNKGALLQEGKIIFTGDIKETISKYTQAFYSDELNYDVSDYSKRPRGNKFAVIEKISINKSLLSPIDSLEVEVLSRTLEESTIGKKVHIAIFIMDEMNNCLYHFNSTAIDYAETFAETNKATFLINDLNLTKGTYSINAHLSSNVIEYDYVEGVVSISVDSQTIFTNQTKFVGKIFKTFEIE
ncbi:MAG: ABC transporter ATP-binding protein [Crocinitomicaceae bacterium]|nr:ABC transporter ATP-binding protein [Crocinitomicaceae bacterium]